MNRNDFLSQLGLGASALLIAPMCLGGLAGCSKSGSNNSNYTGPTGIDFTVDVSTGTLATNGGFLVQNSVIIARTLAGVFIAVSAACTHQGVTVTYQSAANDFYCPSHGAKFSSTGSVTQGPVSTSLTKYNTSLTGTILRVFS